MRTSRFLVLATASVCGVLLAPVVARAHGIEARVTVADDGVKLIAYFDDDTPAEFAEVTVTDASGNQIATGKTDERGVWTCPKPAPGEYKVVVRCLGHAATVKFAVSGEPEAPATFTGPRMNKRLGLLIGVAGLLGFSGVYWLFRLRRRTRQN